jgi:hypothetical protein
LRGASGDGRSVPPAGVTTTRGLALPVPLGQCIRRASEHVHPELEHWGHAVRLGQDRRRDPRQGGPEAPSHLRIATLVAQVSRSAGGSLRQDIWRCSNRLADGRLCCRPAAVHLVATPQRDGLYAVHETRLDTSPAVRLVGGQGHDSARGDVLWRRVGFPGREATPVADRWDLLGCRRVVRGTSDRSVHVRTLHLTLHDENMACGCVADKSTAVSCGLCSSRSLGQTERERAGRLASIRLPG